MNWLAVILFTLTNTGHAAPGVSSAATAGFKNPDVTTGLCTPDNKEQELYQVGYCKAIYEKMVKPGCTKDLIEELRLRTLQDPKQPGWDKLKNKTAFDAFQCNSKPNEKGESKFHIKDLAKDPQKYAEFIMQFFALVSINESDWDPKLKHQPNSGESDDAQGLLNLTRAKTDDKRYECGCKTDDTTDGKSPGPQDPNYSLTCGVSMGLHWIAKDDQTYGRDLDKAAKNAATTKSNKTSSNDAKKEEEDEWRGVARVFPSLQNREGGESAQSELLRLKLVKYCEKYAFTGGMSPIEGDLTQDLGSGTGDAGSTQ